MPTAVVYLQRWCGWCHVKLWPSRSVQCTPYNRAPSHFMQRRIRKVHACLAVTCHLHFWQNDRYLLRAAALTRGCNGYRNKSQHTKDRQTETETDRERAQKNNNNLCSEAVPLVESMHFVFTRMPSEGYRRRLRSLLLYLCYVFRVLINSLVC